MLNGEKVRQFLSTINSAELSYLELQISVAVDAKKMLKEFDLDNEKFSNLMELSSNECEKYLNGSFEYSIMHLCKFSELWETLEIEKKNNSKVENTTQIDSENNIKIGMGSIIRCKHENKYDYVKITKEICYEIFEVLNSYNSKYFKIEDDNGKNFMVTEQNIKNKELWEIVK
jgi:hypothetical protein